MVSVRPDGEGALVQTSTRTIRADRVMLCAGPGMPDFLRDLELRIPLVVRKEQTSNLAVRHPSDYAPGRFPLCIRHFDTPIFSSIFPVFESPGIKMMIERKSPVGDPTDFSVDPQHEARVLSDALELIAGVTGEIFKSETCRYTLTRDGDFVVDKHPAHPQILICSACSGHGFKFAVAIGEMLLELAGGADLPAAFSLFGLGRSTLR